ncbi:MAG: hypothetical protein ACMXYL_04650 [Candidatus Woesearchaeota archaeon]
MKGQITENMIKAILMVAGLMIFLGIYLITTNAVQDMDLPCRWSSQLSASGLPVQLRCTVKYTEITESMIRADDDIKLRNMIAEEMANCFAKLGSGRYSQVTRNSPATWIANPRQSLNRKISSMYDNQYCVVCTHLYTREESITFSLGNYYVDHLENTIPTADTRTYAEIFYDGRDEHELLSRMREKTYDDVNELFIIYAEKDNKNAVFLVDTDFIGDHGLCGGRARIVEEES